jgi:3-hydroxyisobutyrate dehydrogenase
MSSIKKLGWIGTGVMGKSMCKHLLKSGYDLSVYNRTEEKTRELIDMGAKFVDPQRMSKNCDAIFLMLGYPSDVEEMTIGSNGILKNMMKGSYLIDHTTSSPNLAKKIEEQSSKLGIYSFDAPVSGGDIGARNGKLVVMCGGDRIFFPQIECVMSNYSAKIKLFGPAGQGQNAKMANQIIIGSTMVGLVEGLIYGYKSGLDLNDLIGLLSTGAAASFSMTSYGPRILKRDFDPGFYVDHLVKDLKIALEECEKMNIKLKGLELAYSLYSFLQEEGHGRKGTQSLILALEKMNKLNLL